MRELTGHKVNPANDKLVISVVDEPGLGGAPHAYLIAGTETKNNPSFGAIEARMSEFMSRFEFPILFQNGPINDVGVNGLTHEALLAILIDRMEGFQAGPYASPDNQEALEAMRTAQAALQRRTKARMARGVEGTHVI